MEIKERDLEVEANKSKIFKLIEHHGRRAAPGFEMLALLLIATLTCIIRIFSVIRFESIIHEFDPWFNYRATRYLVDNGAYEFWNWFDPLSWYPYGRNIGSTTFPGLMFTSAALHWISNKLFIPLDIKEVCVFLAPIFAALTSILSHFFVKEITGKTESGLLAALMMGMVPGYISRSVAGSYDNEAIAIFALISTFYFFIKAVKTGSFVFSILTCFAYFYMVAAWGGYLYIINLSPLFTLFLIVIGRSSFNLYTAYCIFYVIGNVLSVQIQFVGTKILFASEHMLSHLVFITINSVQFYNFLSTLLPQKTVKTLVNKTVIISSISIGSVLFLLVIFGKINVSDRIISLLDPTYAKKYNPIVASVSEHQPSTWSSFFIDMHYSLIFAPLGVYYCFKRPTTGRLFIAVYGLTSVYFAANMIRLMLLSAPALCFLSAIGISDTVYFFVKQSKHFGSYDLLRKKHLYGCETIFLFFITLSVLLLAFIFHCTWIAAEAYSSPSIILSSRDSNNKKVIIDDFREAYYWLNMNTEENSKIISWWDYGYQISGMSSRPVLVDNNTSNTEHIANIGAVLF